MMIFKQQSVFFTTSGAILLLTLGLSACANSAKMQHGMDSTPSDPSTATHPMPGMDHGTGMHQSMNMNLGPKDEFIDLRFIDAMIPHHQGAVEMAKAALENSARPEMKQLAEAIIAAQEQEIQQMRDWRRAWYPDASDEPMMYDAEMGHMMPMSEEMRSMMMMNMDLGAADDQFDLRFINGMIPHHEGALVMAQEILEKSDRPEIKQLAQNILSSQQQEIEQMKAWRQSWYGQ
jgi:uncharacterized protein (DUF305 family)